MDDINFGDAGLINEDKTVKLPGSLRLSTSSLDDNGIYVLDNGFTTFIWLGTKCDSLIEANLRRNINNRKIADEDNDIDSRIIRIINSIQTYSKIKLSSKQISGSIELIVQGSAEESKFMVNLHEDTTGEMNYETYYKMLIS